jgi:periplasmic protein TonB
VGILSQASSSHMSSDTAALPGGSPANPKSPNAGGSWLGSQSVFDTRDERKLGRAMGVSMMIHGGVLAIIMLALTVAPQQSAQLMQDLKVVFLSEAGPGGGGGGSPAPAPAKKMEVPKHAAPTPAIVTPVPQPTVPPPPIPILNAPVETSASSVLQASGSSSVSLADIGGGGRGRGLGRGSGDGVGDGKDKGFGGGAYAPGSGVNNPILLQEEKPKYTSEAMRAKIQGVAEVEAVVGENGLVTDVRIHKSLDKVFGLDLEALAAAKKWRFRPAMFQGKPVAFKVIIQLEFRLH